MSWLKSITICLAIFALFFPKANAQEKNSDSSIGPTAPAELQTTIIGFIHNAFAEKNIDLRFHTDLISFNEQLFELPVGSDKQFAMSFMLGEATVATLSYYGMEFQLYLEPGDELHINFDALDFWGTVRFTGKGAEHNEYLYALEKKFGQWNDRSIVYEIAQREALDYRNLLDRLRGQKKDFLTKFPNRSKFSEPFQDYALADINYWWGYQLLRYRMEHPLANGLETPMLLPKDYYYFLNHLVISNDKALNNRNYLYFLDQYLSFRNENPSELNGSGFYLNSILITAPSMLILAEPDKPPILAELKKGERAIFLEKKSDRKSKILIGDALHEDYWYLVRTAEGIEGWVLGIGSKVEDLSNAAIKIDESGNTKYRNAEKLIRGKAMSYAIANDIYWRSHITPPESLEVEVDEFLTSSEVYAYRQIVKGAYKEALGRKSKRDTKAQTVYGSYNYLTIRQAEILSSPGEKVKEPAAIIDLRIAESRKTETTREVPALKQDSENTRSTRKKKKRRTKNRPVPIKPKPEEKIAQANPEPEPEPEIQVKIIPQEKTKTALASVDTMEVKIQNTPEGRTGYIAIDATPVKTTFKAKNIKIKARGPLNQKLSLVLFEDPILVTEQEIKLKSVNASTREGRVDFGRIQNGYLAYGKERVSLYFQKEGDLQLTFDPNNFLESLRFTGDGAVANNYLLALARYKKPMEKALKQKLKDTEPMAFKTFMEENRNLLHRFFSEQKIKPDRKFEEYAKAEIDYWYAYQLLNYLWEYPLHNGLEAPMTVPQEYFQFFEQIIISNEFALPNLNYTYFLDQFFDYQSGLAANENLSGKELAKKLLKGDPLQYYTAKLLSIDCKRGKAMRAGPEIDRFIKSCDNEVYNNVLRQVYNEAKGLSKGDAAPSFVLKDINGKTVSLSDFKDKVIYLDFWATWCSPCVMQMRNSKQWKSEFEGRNDVAFLYLSLDKDIHSWENFVRSQGLGGQHLKADGGDVYRSKIARLYKVKRMPHAYVIDKEGRVAYNSATDSGKVRVAEVLRRLLH